MDGKEEGAASRGGGRRRKEKKEGRVKIGVDSEDNFETAHGRVTLHKKNTSKILSPLASFDPEENC